MLSRCSNGDMNARWAIVVLLSTAPWSSSAAPALTERRGCRPGYSLNPISDLCELCPDGTFTDSYNWESECQRCSICNGGRLMVAPCNASSNTLCRCADDHYEHEDGCSPKLPTTRSGIDELSPLLLGFGQQIGTEIQKVQTKFDNLTKTVDRLQEVVASGTYAQERNETYVLVVMVIVIVVVVIAIVVAAIFLIQRYAKRPKNAWCCKQLQGGQGIRKQNGVTLADQQVAKKPSESSNGRKENAPDQDNGNARVPNDGTPTKGQAQGGDGVADAESPRTATAVSADMDLDDTLSSSTLNNPAVAVGLPSKRQDLQGFNEGIAPDGRRGVHNRRRDTCPEEGIPVHSDPDEATQALLGGPSDN